MIKLKCLLSIFNINKSMKKREKKLIEHKIKIKFQIMNDSK